MARRLTPARPRHRTSSPALQRTKLAEARRRRFLIVGLVIIIVWFLALVAGVGASQADSNASALPAAVSHSL